MLRLYILLMTACRPLLETMLRRRAAKGKEDPQRMGERQGLASLKRPSGTLIWCHAASVGEAQSTLILIEALLERLPGAHILVTTGTVTSANIMQKRLPARAFHQYYPLDHPAWVKNFLDHWRPDLAIWMESELWPAMLGEIEQRKIPAFLVNARLSPRSLRRWKHAAGMARALLGAFTKILTQTEDDSAAFRTLGAQNVITTDNLKYSAAPLPCDDSALAALRQSLSGRPVWLYASTHKGEEDLALRLHAHLKNIFPGLLTIIVPRHPERRNEITALCEKSNLRFSLRTEAHVPPRASDDLYIADTLGELGLFYRLVPVACIGRSFSADGGGGHNPIEAAQLDCAILHGPRVQNLQKIFEDMNKAGSALRLKDEEDFEGQLQRLLGDPQSLSALQQNGKSFAQERALALNHVLSALTPWLEKAKARSPGSQAA